MRLIILLSILALFACANEPVRDEKSLYGEYQAFSALIQKDYQQAKETKITQELADFVDRSQENIPEEFEVNLLESLGTLVTTEHSHYESKQGKIGCLTLNGLDEESEPVSLSLYYVRENGTWLFNNFLVNGNVRDRNYPTEPYCPLYD